MKQQVKIPDPVPQSILEPSVQTEGKTADLKSRTRFQRFLLNKLKLIYSTLHLINNNHIKI
uniref:Uncharacterized protein n=1 Tax=Megaselia scalaris TaxID=36166 RepID=T1GNU4_MEGSC